MARVVIIGPGRVGTALAVTLQQIGHEILGAYCRDVDSRSAQLFRRLTQAPTWLFPASGVRSQAHGRVARESIISEATNLDVPDPATTVAHETSQLPADVFAADLFLVTVPDKAVTATAQTLVDSGLLRQRTPNPTQSTTSLTRKGSAFDTSDQPVEAPSVRPIVAHTAGSLAATALAPADSAGARCICMHPLQTVASATLAPECFHGIAFTLDGEATAIAEVSQWIREFGAKASVIEGGSRSRYHAAAVLASNAIVALASTAVELSGLPDGLEALLPLMRGALANLEQLGLPDALTGPIERGDVTTVTQHLSALQSNPTAFDVYRTLSLATVNVAARKQTLSAAEIAAFRALLSPDDEQMGGS